MMRTTCAFVVVVAISSIAFTGAATAETAYQMKVNVPGLKAESVQSGAAYGSCQEILAAGASTGDGVYSIKPEGSPEAFDVLCDMTTDGGGWTVFQHRFDGSVDFYRSWSEYKAGFGAASEEYWLGNDRINVLAGSGTNELRVQLWEKDTHYYAAYSAFTMADETSKYRLYVSGYSGTAGDNLANQSGEMFTTYDSDNDSYSSGNCASNYKAGWWYDACHHSNLNGLHGQDTYAGNVWWNAGPLGLVSLDKTTMMVR